ncbi:isoquinoline 1-oxidoreductase, beta subunit [Loktanella fryxellensis]|uniref:Isoquinoline 1-oxidoreductase, beta subunit n=1 Tax=Loktanella fryxellensis TaxID=245187 RepID=A0A1H8IP58_9RHOB|nr:hypothetical protein [Loktanella fryxellensis]SEN70111.1 isoquinoline 1-oxidoreductase, beta subunit [Loktanella fryxellensis]
MTLHITMNGRAFRRRSNQDAIAEASFLAARMQGHAIKLIWSRGNPVEDALSKAALDRFVAARLWKVSEELAGKKFA